MTRRWWMIVAAACLLLSGLVLPTAAGASSPPGQPVPLVVGEPIRFHDLPEEHYAYWPVAELREEGVLAMNSAGLFRPNDPVSRGEFLKMLLAARRIEADSQECQGVFSDAPCEAWYTPTAEMAYRLGILEEKSGGLMGPHDSLTRQELFTLAIRALGLRQQAARLARAEAAETLHPFRDQDEVAPWARSSVALAVREGLMEGDSSGRLRPAALATRAEAAVVVNRLLLDPDQVPTANVDGQTVLHRQVLEMRATAYCSGEAGVGTVTATGLKVRAGTVAVDPEVIPLGTLLYVEGYGYAIAADTGGAVKGNKIDLFVPELEKALRFGTQTRRVWVLP